MSPSLRPEKPYTHTRAHTFRLPRPLLDELTAWANDEGRSLNTQVIILLRRALAFREVGGGVRSYSTDELVTEITRRMKEARR